MLAGGCSRAEEVWPITRPTQVGGTSSAAASLLHLVAITAMPTRTAHFHLRQRFLHARSTSQAASAEVRVRPGRFPTGTAGKNQWVAIVLLAAFSLKFVK